MCIAHIFHTVRYDFTRRQRIKHAVMPHRDTVIHCYRIEFGSKASELLDPCLDFLSYLMKMHMTGNELCKRIHNRDDRLAELAVFHSIRSP